MTPQELLKQVADETPVNLRFVGKHTSDQNMRLRCLGNTAETLTILPTYRQAAEHATTKEGLLELVHAAIGPYADSLGVPYKVVCVLCLNPFGQMAWVGAALDHTVDHHAKEGGLVVN